MTAQDIIAAIIKMNKDFDAHEIAEMIFGKASVGDLPAIKAALYDHMSSNEMNGARYAVSLI